MEMGQLDQRKDIIEPSEEFQPMERLCDAPQVKKRVFSPRMMGLSILDHLALTQPDGKVAVGPDAEVKEEGLVEEMKQEAVSF